MPSQTTARIEKTIKRQQERITAGDYYEAHQQLRTISARYIKALNWDAALTVNYEGAIALLRANQGGSGGDLACSFVGVLSKGQLPLTPSVKVKALSILRAFPSEESTRKNYINELISWSASAGDYANGDPDFHHVAGSIYASEIQSLDAERHLLLGTKDSVNVLSEYEFSRYAQDEAHTPALYAARYVLPYILIGNLRAAISAHHRFLDLLMKSTSSPPSQIIDTSPPSQHIFPALPLLNFLSLLLLTIHRGNSNQFKKLQKHYAPYLKEVPSWKASLLRIGELYFGIQIPRQGNPLFDMMGSMMGFGGPTPKPVNNRIQAPPPVVEGLD